MIQIGDIMLMKKENKQRKNDMVIQIGTTPKKHKKHAQIDMG